MGDGVCCVKEKFDLMIRTMKKRKNNERASFRLMDNWAALDLNMV